MPGLSRELLQDSHVTLRLVDELVAELAQEEDESGGSGALALLVKVYAEIQRILYDVRKSRGILEEAAIDHLENTNAKLREVSSTTEFAATNMLDGVDRALGLVDRIADGPADPVAVEALRDELHSLVNALQFQDIISQQLDYASALIGDMEIQLRRVVEMFASRVLQDGTEPARRGAIRTPTGAFDPAASIADAATRQSLADHIFDTG